MPERPDSPWKTQVKRRIDPDRIVLSAKPFAKFVSQRNHNVSERALFAAIRLITTGITEALLEGYAVSFHELGTFETRVQAPRRYYSRANKSFFMAAASTHVHFKKAPSLTKTIRYGSVTKLGSLIDNPAVKPIIPKK